VLLLHRARAHAPERRIVADGLVLGCGCALLFAAVHSLTVLAAQGVASTQALVQSGLLSVASVALALIGRTRSLPEATVLAVLCCVALAAKTLLLDLRALEGGALMAAVGLLGAAAAGLSLALRRRTAAVEE